MIFDQSDFDIRCEWGQRGVDMLAPISDVVIIVDVFSFSTAVSLAVSNGAAVYPFRSTDKSVEEFAKSVNALLAGPRGESKYSLSPLTLSRLEPGDRIVLPSPNGSTLSLSTGDTITFAGCLRNAKVVATEAMDYGSEIAVIPCGERWDQKNSLRPAFEDQLGAGAIISYLKGSLSPEAKAALSVFEKSQQNLLELLANCSSGKELIAKGYKAEIDLIGKLNADKIAPILQNGAYISYQF